MTTEEAKVLLKCHGFIYEELEHPKMQNGFLGMLRPFRGELHEENYHEVIAAIKCLADHIRDEEKIDREVISAIWGICHLTRSYAIEENGMLRRNNLISEVQIKLLEKWVDTISYTTMMILDGSGNVTAFDLYEDE